MLNRGVVAVEALAVVQRLPSMLISTRHDDSLAHFTHFTQPPPPLLLLFILLFSNRNHATPHPPSFRPPDCSPTRRCSTNERSALLVGRMVPGSHPPCWVRMEEPMARRSEHRTDDTVHAKSHQGRLSLLSSSRVYSVLPVPTVPSRKPLPDPRPPCHRQHGAGQPSHSINP